MGVSKRNRLQATRRDLLRGSLALPAGAWLMGAGCSNELGLHADLVSAARGIDGLYYLSRTDEQGALRWSHAIDPRGHGGCFLRERNELTLVARRAGEEMWILDASTGELLHQVAATSGRHFFGHAVYDPSGEFLYATENDFDTAEIPDLGARDSVIGVYERARNFQRVGELPAHGIGAHELLLSADGQTLFVAIGGIYTHPSRERETLNPDALAPALHLVDRSSGELRDAYVPNDPQLSLRHMARSADDRVAFGMQYQGDNDTTAAVVGIYDRELGAIEVEAPRLGFAALKNYVGSVAVSDGADGEAGAFAATSPRGNRIEVWGMDGSYRGGDDANDVCGIAAHPSDDGFFLASTGTGDLLLVSAKHGRIEARVHNDDRQWDNHMLSIA